MDNQTTNNPGFEGINKALETLYSINDGLRANLSPETSGIQRFLENEGIEVIVELDPNMPKIYPKLIEDLDFCDVITSIYEEIHLVKPSRVLYQTELAGNLQLLRIFHNGRKVPEELLAELERVKDLIKRYDHTPVRGGNQIAYHRLRKFNADLRLENLTVGLYTVCTTVEIPVPE